MCIVLPVLFACAFRVVVMERERESEKKTKCVCKRLPNHLNNITSSKFVFYYFLITNMISICICNA